MYCLLYTVDMHISNGCMFRLLLGNKMDVPNQRRCNTITQQFINLNKWAKQLLFTAILGTLLRLQASTLCTDFLLKSSNWNYTCFSPLVANSFCNWRYNFIAIVCSHGSGDKTKMESNLQSWGLMGSPTHCLCVSHSVSNVLGSYSESHHLGTVLSSQKPSNANFSHICWRFW